MLDKDEVLFFITSLKRQNVKWLHLHDKLTEELLDSICESYETIDDLLIAVEDFNL